MPSVVYSDEHLRYVRDEMLIGKTMRQAGTAFESKYPEYRSKKPNHNPGYRIIGIISRGTLWRVCDEHQKKKILDYVASRSSNVGGLRKDRGSSVPALRKIGVTLIPLEDD